MQYSTYRDREAVAHTLAAVTAKACLPTVVRLKDGTISWSELDNWES